ncbi:MAG: glutamylcysteine synthetase, partial [Lachnospiraceae bacterium]|nr:glutamylcysteine synthetase [Lachnospiraceae bacterium]
MTDDTLNEAIYERYIKPTKRKRTKSVGLEFEFPIVNITGKPVDFSVIHQLTDEFIKEHAITDVHYDDDGYVYWAGNAENGDSLSFDCSYNTLEFSFGIESDIGILKERFSKYYNDMQRALKKRDHLLTGMGINPGYKVNRNVPVVSERYRMLFHHLCSYENYGNEILFHNHPNFGLFSCASQVQMDVEEENLVEVLNTFTKLEPLKALLFANSIWTEDANEFLCSRDYFWRNSLHGLNRHNVDMYGLQFESIEEIILYIRSMSLYCVQREGRYINFSPVPLADYFSSEKVEGEIFENGAYKKIEIHPEISDLEHLRSFKFDDLTLRGTVEFRSVCEQPVKEIMASGACHAGLMENLHALTYCLQNDLVIYH